MMLNKLILTNQFNVILRGSKDLSGKMINKTEAISSYLFISMLIDLSTQGLRRQSQIAAQHI